MEKQWFIVPVLAFLLVACQGVEQTDQSANSRFRRLPAGQTGLDFVNRLNESEAFNIIDYLYYYNGGGVAVGDINNDGLPDLYFTGNQTPNKLYLNQGNLRFTDITATAGVAGAGDWSSGVAMADVNGDGWLDIYVCQVAGHQGLEGRNQLFLNKGATSEGDEITFREAAAEYGLDFSGLSTQAAFFDYDLDGDLDCYLLNHSVHSTESYGRSEIRRRRDTLAGDRLLRNDGGAFTDVSTTSGVYGSRVGYGLGIGTGDVNNDGYPDIYISNDFHENDYLYYNNGDGTFTDATRSALAHSSTFSMGNDIGDLNNDGRLDIVTLDMKPRSEVVDKRSVGADPYNIYQLKLGFGYYYQFPHNMLQLNRGPAAGDTVRFSEVGHLAGMAATDWSWSPLIADLDLDGRQDLFITNGIWRRPNDLDYLKYTSNKQVQRSATDLEMAERMPGGQVANFAFRNEGALRFADQSTAWGFREAGCSNGAAYADLDRDGDLELVTNDLNREAGLYENRTRQDSAFHFLTVQLRAKGRNTFGIGARVTVVSGGDRQFRELYTTRGFQASVPPELYFGLGKASRVDTLLIRWPDGQRQLLTDLAADRVLRVEQSDETQSGEALPFGESPQALLQKSGNKGLNFRHRENNFVDFDREQLLPHKISTQGPRLATGDVDGNGWVDVYICGARGQRGQLWLQDGAGNFAARPIPTDPSIEEVDAALLDADGDGDLDLYLVCGGGESAGQEESLLDQLWLNNGEGAFQRKRDALPRLYVNGACVEPFDMDADGDIDLFVGGRSAPGAYGMAPRSAVLRNDGNGIFYDATNELAPGLDRIGMVTDARVLAEEALQLIIVGEWMPVTVYTIPEKGRWQKDSLPNSNGWWNRLEIADLDGDGRSDLMLGNLGLNTELRTSPDQPVELFVGDFDGNQQPDPVMTHYRQGKRYPFYKLDELSKQLVFLRRNFNDYLSFAESALESIIPTEQLEQARRLEVHTFANSVAWQGADGRFELQALARRAQMAPLFAFLPADVNRDGKTDLLAGGNWYGLPPALGRQDASFGHTILGTADRSFRYLDPSKSGWATRGQIRDFKLVPTARGPLLLIAKNDAELEVRQLQKRLPK